MVSTVEALQMSLASWIAAAPFNIGWQEIVFILLIIAIISIPALVVLGIVLLTMRHQRRKRGAPPPIPSPEAQTRSSLCCHVNHLTGHCS
jgi:heme/copper-type cytochrome/quinol oxidase subunit 2